MANEVRPEIENPRTDREEFLNSPCAW
jgi:hypothetical protein